MTEVACVWETSAEVRRVEEKIGTTPTTTATANVRGKTPERRDAVGLVMTIYQEGSKYIPLPRYAHATQPHHITSLLRPHSIPIEKACWTRWVFLRPSVACVAAPEQWVGTAAAGGVEGFASLWVVSNPSLLGRMIKTA